MSGKRSVKSNSNEDGRSKAQSNSITGIHFEDGDNTSPEVIEQGKKCSNELNQAADEYEAKMKEIANMPPDPNYNDEGFRSKDMEKVETPTKEQAEARKAAEEKHFEDLSIDGGIAKDIGEANPNASKEEIMSMIKDKLVEQGGSGYYDTPGELDKDANAAYNEYKNAKYAAADETPCDKVTVLSSQDITCKSQAQKEAYEKATQEYMAKCKQSMEKYRDAKLKTEQQKGEK